MIETYRAQTKIGLSLHNELTNLLSNAPKTIEEAQRHIAYSESKITAVLANLKVNNDRTRTR